MGGEDSLTPVTTRQLQVDPPVVRCCDQGERVSCEDNECNRHCPTSVNSWSSDFTLIPEFSCDSSVSRHDRVHIPQSLLVCYSWKLIDISQILNLCNCSILIWCQLSDMTLCLRDNLVCLLVIIIAVLCSGVFWSSSSNTPPVNIQSLIVAFISLMTQLLSVSGKFNIS